MAAKRFAKPKKQYLPLSKSTFSKLVEGNCIYVDKTRYIHPMVEAGGAYFLSRPRRFGKSLMVSVLKEIFQGNRALFKGYWIYDRIAWEKYPVIHLDFLGIDHRTLGIEKAIANKLDRIAKEYATQCTGDSISEKFFDLIENLAREKETVVLVDEYDKPITDCLEDIKTAAYNRDILRNFYSVLKSQEGKIKFLFMTGISRFTRISIFSELNHLTDITFHKDYSNLLGYTDAEIELYFDAYIHEWLQLHKGSGSSKTQLLEKLKDYYNGYSWNGKDFVYNPFSINHFFNNMEFKNYWFASGTTTSLVKMVKEKGSAVENWEHLEVREQFFDKFDIANININLMLFQTGYLTVKKRLEDAYVLSYPNREVEYALLNNLMEVYSGRSLEDSEKLIKEIKESLEKKQIDSFIQQMKAFIASIPYNLVEADAERFYHLVFYLVLKLLIGKVSPEKYTNLGRIDTVVETGNFIYVIEFKMGSADEAFKQILEKKYYEQYLNQSKTVILFGIGFSVEDRNISGYKSIELSREDLSMYKSPDAVKQLAEQVNNPEGFKKEIYISYAWGGESEEIANRLEAAFKEKGITIIRDRRDLGFKGRIKEFMERIGRGKCVIVVINKKYLESENCMYELIQISKTGRFSERIFPVVLEDAKIYKPIDRIRYVKYWDKEIQDLDEQMKGVSQANLQGFREDIDLYADIRKYLPRLTDILRDMNTLSVEIHSETGFEELVRAAAAKIEE